MKLPVLCTLVALTGLVEGLTYIDLVREEWKTFKVAHAKTYHNETEDNFRMNILMENRYKIAQHNSRFHKGEVSFSLKLNQFSDLLHHEFVSEMSCFNQSLPSNGSLPALLESVFVKPEGSQLPDYVDWRESGAVTEVKNQGQCGSCWSFSATGSLEGQHFLKTGNRVSLSEQNLVDCSFQYENNGCNGGRMDMAFEYVRNNGGIETERSYPYETRVGRCRYRPPPAATCTGYVYIPSGNEEALKVAVATVGPISVAIDASHESFQHFYHGIYYEPACSTTQLNHAVLIIGYGTTSDGRDYWLVKNSWGTAWGNKGYIKMARNRHNNCGIATYAVYPQVGY